MFKFTLPKGAALHVDLPTGGSAIFVHDGDGKFLSTVPPLVLVGMDRDTEQHVSGLPVEWDSSKFQLSGDAKACVFEFDAASAQQAVETAAAAGDASAATMLERIKAAEKQLDLQRKVGLVPADNA